MLSAIHGTRRRVQGVFYGWWIVTAGFILQVLHGGLLSNSFTVYFVPLQAEFGWSRAMLAIGFSFVRFESGLLGPLEGWAVDKLGPRPIALFGILLFGGAFILFGLVESFATFLIVFALMAAGASLAGFLPIMASIINWFRRKRAMAVGIAAAGSSVGGLVVPALAWSMIRYGWRPTAVASGLIIWLVGIPVALLLRHKPERYGYLPDGAQAVFPKEQTQDSAKAALKPGEASTSDYSFSVKEALQTPAFWMISGGHAFSLLAGSTVSLYQVPHMVQQAGLSLEAAGSVVAFLMIMHFVGQLGGGFMADRVNKRALLAICMLGHSAGLLLLAYATTVPQLLLFAVFHGLAWGVRSPIIQAIRADFFGREAFATITGFSNLIIMVAQTGAPIFAGWLADLQGDYRMAFTILAIITGSGSVFFLFARKPVPRGLGNVGRVASR